MIGLETVRDRAIRPDSFLVGPIPPGVYRVEASDGEGREASTTIEVGEGEGEIEVELDLE